VTVPYRYFKSDADLPQRIIVLDGSGSVTFDVLTWLNEQKVPLVKIDWTGNAITVISGDSFAANRERIAWQTETRSDRRKRMDFCNALIARKIEGCMQTLEESLRHSHAWDRAMKRAKDDLVRLANHPPETVNELRLLEARSPIFALGMRRRCYGAHPHAIQFPTNGEPLARVSPEFTPAEAATRRTLSTPS
jgi:CRISPR-associated protein Cas1